MPCVQGRSGEETVKGLHDNRGEVLIGNSLDAMALLVLLMLDQVTDIWVNGIKMGEAPSGDRVHGRVEGQ